MDLKISACAITPELDPDFIPAIKWNNAYRSLTNSSDSRTFFSIALERRDGTTSVYKTMVLPHTDEYRNLNIKYIERILKFLLWMKGGYKIYLAGDLKLCEDIKHIYSANGARAFDYEFIGSKVYGKPLEFIIGDEVPSSFESASSLGRNLDGCRIGFDLGGSDRKCAALIDGKVVYSEEITWDPYFEKDPNYHLDGIRDSINRAAKHLPRVDAIGGSAAGVYVNNEVRAASLFRGVSSKDFESSVRNIFFDLKEEFDGVPFEVVNDGEVTALAGSMSMDTNGVLGISMGTSLAAGYVTPEGFITSWLNELAFVPVDYRENAPADEWSKDIGCGVQYFSQQGVARLIKKSGIDEIDQSQPFPEQLVEVQKLMAENDPRARKIYETIGVYFGYTIAHFSEFYDINSLLVLGRVTSGEGGDIIIEKAKEVLNTEFSQLAEKINITVPDEKSKRHGQAVAAASLPSI